MLYHCFFSSAINYCTSSPCQNGGSCIPAVNSYACSFVNGYVGNKCQTDDMNFFSFKEYLKHFVKSMQFNLFGYTFNNNHY